jgi:hypothetical protein
MGDMVPPGVRLGIVRSISYGLFGKPDRFVPQLRELGATLVRVYVYWSQVEPEPGRYTFTAVDAFLDQLDGSEEVWVTVCSSSRWATRQATDFLPPSPARIPTPTGGSWTAWSATAPGGCTTGSATTSPATSG